MTTPTAARPELEVADIIRQHGEELLKRYGSGLAGVQRQALGALARCRTAALGGHVERCLDCDHRRIAYNSCRNRHCPKCQALARAQLLGSGPVAGAARRLTRPLNAVVLYN